MVRDDRDGPFDSISNEIERVMSDMTRGDVGFVSETHVDMYDGSSTLRLVADLPGVDKDAIDLKCDGETLTISAAGDHHEYGERIRLPIRIDEHPASVTFNNGVLQVTFDRVEDSVAIDVE